MFCPRTDCGWCDDAVNELPVKVIRLQHRAVAEPQDTGRIYYNNNSYLSMDKLG